MGPRIKLSVRQLQEYRTEEGYVNIYMPTQKKMLILEQDNNQPPRGWRWVWKRKRTYSCLAMCFFSVAQKYFQIFGVAGLKEMEMKLVADWVRKNCEDGQGCIDKSFETSYAQRWASSE